MVAYSNSRLRVQNKMEERRGSEMNQRPIAVDTVPVAVRELMESAWQCMCHAETVDDVNVRYSLAHRAALRIAAAVLAVRAHPENSHGMSTRARARQARPQSAWVLLRKVAPELGEWADYFASHASIREAAEAGSPSITSRMADDAVRDAAAFMRDAVVLARGVSAVRAG